MSSVTPWVIQARTRWRKSRPYPHDGLASMQSRTWCHARCSASLKTVARVRRAVVEMGVSALVLRAPLLWMSLPSSQDEAAAAVVSRLRAWPSSSSSCPRLPPSCRPCARSRPCGPCCRTRPGAGSGAWCSTAPQSVRRARAAGSAMATAPSPCAFPPRGPCALRLLPRSARKGPMCMA